MEAWGSDLLQDLHVFFSKASQGELFELFCADVDFDILGLRLEIEVEL